MPMPKEMMDAFLAERLLARMATASKKTAQPHVVPLWYLWDGETMWVSGFRSTRKFKELIANPLVSILVDTDSTFERGMRAVLMEGKAEVITQPRELVFQKTREIYLRYLGEEGVQKPEPQSWIHDDENLVVKLTPHKIYTWYEEKKKE
jgi:nitroimidazol reductase NimA-like FMN-containing flavoprotein (pyridoxamine 5'-phosphate oxidase superfamily)